MSIKRTKYDTWQVRWRDSNHRQLAKSFRTRAQAERFERQVRAKEEAPTVDAIYEPMWRKALRSQLDNQTSIDVDGFNPNGYFVYLLWDRNEDRPIYIGASQNVLARLGNHLVNPDRRGIITRVTLIRCYSEPAMHATEAKLIDFYKPELNLLDGNRRPVGSLPKFDRKAYVVVEAARLIGVPVSTLEGMVERGEVAAKRIGKRTILVPTVELKRLMNGENPGPDVRTSDEDSAPQAG